MGRKCPVPNYKLDYKSQVKDTKTTFHKFRKECENKIHRGEKWFMTTESFICGKHSKRVVLFIIPMTQIIGETETAKGKA